MATDTGSQDLTQPYVVAIEDGNGLIENEKGLAMDSKKEDDTKPNKKRQRNETKAARPKRQKKTKTKPSETKEETVDFKFVGGTPPPYNCGPTRFCTIRQMDGLVTRGACFVSDLMNEVPFPTSVRVKNNPTTLEWMATVQKFITQGRTGKAFKRNTHSDHLCQLILAFGKTVAEEQKELKQREQDRMNQFESIRQTFYCQHPDALAWQDERVRNLLSRAEPLMPDDKRTIWIRRRNKAIQAEFNAFCEEHWNVENMNFK